MAWFDDFGNIFLKGIFEPNTIPEDEAESDEFRIQDANSKDVMIINGENGCMYIKAWLQPQWEDPCSLIHEFIIKDSNDQPVSYIDDLGNVFLKGLLYDDIWP